MTILHQSETNQPLSSQKLYQRKLTKKYGIIEKTYVSNTAYDNLSSPHSKRGTWAEDFHKAIS